MSIEFIIEDDEPIISKSDEAEKLEKKRAYMRNYMKARYHDDQDFSKKYSNSVKTKNRFNICEEEWKLYGIYLADVVQLRKILAKLPKDVAQQAFNEFQEKN